MPTESFVGKKMLLNMIFGQDKKKAGLYTRKDRNSKHVLSLVTSNERPFYVRFADFFTAKIIPKEWPTF